MSDNKKEAWKEETFAEMGERMGIDPCGEQMGCAQIGKIVLFFNLDPEYGGVMEIHTNEAKWKRLNGVIRYPDVKVWLAEHPEEAIAAANALRIRQEWIRKWQDAHWEASRSADRGCIRLRVGDAIIDLPAGGDCTHKPVYVMHGVKKGVFPWPKIPPTFQFRAGVRGHVELLSYDCEINGVLAAAVLEADNPEIWIGDEGEVLVIEGVV